MTETMNAIVLHRHGGLEAMVDHANWPIPNPGPDDVLIRVGAYGVNNTDVTTRSGWHSKTETEATASDAFDEVDDQDPTWCGAHISLLRIQGADAVREVVLACKIAGPIVNLDLRTFYLSDLTFTGSTAFPPHILGDLIRNIERGEIRLMLAATCPLSATIPNANYHVVWVCQDMITAEIAGGCGPRAKDSYPPLWPGPGGGLPPGIAPLIAKISRTIEARRHPLARAFRTAGPDYSRQQVREVLAAWRITLPEAS